MDTILFVTAIYFILGVIAFILTITNNPNWFSKTICKYFYTINDYNKFMLFYWVIPILISVLTYICYNYLY